MPLGLQLAVVALAAYALGSVSFAIVVSRAMALPDPRSYGSGNPGATNVLRSGSKAAALLTLAGDAAKGWLAVWLAQLCTGDALAMAVAGAAAFLGHLYPVFYRFRGGKGVATAAGTLFGFDLWLGVGTIATFAIIVAFFRYVSLASIVAAAFAVFFAWFLKLGTATVVAVAAMAVLLTWRHRENIKRLAAGTESKLGAKKATPPPDPSAA
ncbi:MAG: glycerol-3-phosphate 1-O-acyltransferase PlsY [Betaproteobacteria bacterium]|nr:glycerol-3-phosphate 1-O-acyltransferase PlsY [Betaproteobacteria bacterium]